MLNKGRKQFLHTKELNVRQMTSLGKKKKKLMLKFLIHAMPNIVYILSANLKAHASKGFQMIYFSAYNFT